MKKPGLSIFYISTALSLAAMGDNILYIVLPACYSDLGLVPFQVGVLLSVNRWIRLLTNQAAEYCYRRYPSEVWLLAALAAGAVTTAAYGLAHSFIVFLAARVLWGISFSFLRQAGIMMTVQLSSENRLGRLMGVFHGINALWRSTGMFLGGLSHDLFGFSVTLISFGAFTLLGVPLGRMSQRQVEWKKGGLSEGGPIRRHVGLISGGFTLGLVGEGMIVSTLGLILKQQTEPSFHLMGMPVGTATLTGIVIGLRFLIHGLGSPFLGAVADRAGRLRTIPFLFLFSALSLFAAAVQTKPFFLIALTCVFFICVTTLMVVLSAQAGYEGPRSVAALSTATDLGMSLGPLIGWSIAQFEWPVSSIFLVGGAIVLFNTIDSFRSFGSCRTASRAGH